MKKNACLQALSLVLFIVPILLAETVTLTPVLDNTIYEFDPADTDSLLNSNGRGDFISAGRSRSRSLLRRGLLQFDLTSIPANTEVVPGTVSLSLEVVDAPTRDTSGADREFWLVRLEEIWGEGTSTANAGISGAGSGAAATLGDATWLHASYNPDTHDPRVPDSSAGHWNKTAVLGNGPVNPLDYGLPAGSVPAAPYLGPVNFAGSSLESDINDWLAHPTSNYGWLLLGDETVVGDNVSSNRGFASRESANPPQLSFEYRVVPEPGSALLFILGLAVCRSARSHAKARSY